MTDGMTNEQFKTVLQMIITIVEQAETKEKAIEKIKELLNK